MLSFADPLLGIHSTLIDPYAELLSLEERINFAKHLEMVERFFARSVESAKRS